MKNNPARRPTKGKKRKAKALDAMEDIDPLDTLMLDKITIHIARKYGSTAYLIPQVTLARYVERIRSHPEMPFILDPWQEDLCQRLEQAFWCANARKFRFTKVEIAGRLYAVAPNGFRIDAAEFNRKENLGTLAAIHAPPQFGKSNIIAIAYPEIGGSGGTLADVIRLVLREILWCKLESTNGLYIHFGYDYYMYVGSPVSSQRAIDYGKQNGLYVEEMESPYLTAGEA